MTETERIAGLLAREGCLPLERIVQEEIREWQSSEGYLRGREALEYYNNVSDVQRKHSGIAQRTNTRLEHAFVRKLVDQKADTLLAQDFSLDVRSPEYGEGLRGFFDDDFRRLLRGFGRAAVKQGIAYMQPFYDGRGRLRCRLLPFCEVVPLWRDAAHDEMDAYIHVYTQIVYEGVRKVTLRRAEYWDAEGVQCFVERGGRFFPDAERPGVLPHYTRDGQDGCWAELPLLWCRYNEEELPLQYFIRELVDDYNWQKSVTADVLRDVAKFVYVLRGYGGQDVGEFLHDLRDALAIKLDADGGVDKLQADINIDAVAKYLELQRRDIFDLAGGVDVQSPELGTISSRALRLRYTDLLTDCAALGGEIRAALRRLKYFIDEDLRLRGGGDFDQESFTVTFNMDMPTDEEEIFRNAQIAGFNGLSQRTILSNIPWVRDVDEELGRLREEGRDAQCGDASPIVDKKNGGRGR